MGMHSLSNSAACRLRSSRRRKAMRQRNGRVEALWMGWKEDVAEVSQRLAQETLWARLVRLYAGAPLGLLAGQRVAEANELPRPARARVACVVFHHVKVQNPVARPSPGNGGQLETSFTFLAKSS